MKEKGQMHSLFSVKMGGATIAFMTIVTLGHPSWAQASFDCAKAAAPIEKLICADKELATLDVALADAYSDKRRTASPNQRSELRQNQVEWIKNLVHGCDIKGNIPKNNPLYDDKLKCIKVYYKTRILFLKEGYFSKEKKNRLESLGISKFSYKLVMSTNSRVCYKILKTYNNLLGAMKYKNQEYLDTIFESHIYDELIADGFSLPPKYYNIYGDKEKKDKLLTGEIYAIHGNSQNLTEIVSIYRGYKGGARDDLIKLYTDIKKLSAGMNYQYFPLTGSGIILTKWPNNHHEKNKEQNITPQITGNTSIYLFIADGEYYIVFNEYATFKNGTRYSENSTILVASLNNNRLDHVCYIGLYPSPLMQRAGN